MAEYIYNYTPDDNSGFDGNTGDGGVNGEMSGFTPITTVRVLIMAKTAVAPIVFLPSYRLF